MVMNRLVLSVFSLIFIIHVKSQPNGFINIDCGIHSNSIYVDANTNLPYSSDDQYIDTGVNYNISAAYVSNSLAQQELTLRSFPNGNRNCYTLQSLTQNKKYLVRASFTYGNYDGKLSQSLMFDLHIGVNFWTRMAISNSSETYRAEALVNATTADHLSVCLINTNGGTPFISSLELRQIKDYMYTFDDNADTQYMKLFARWNFGAATGQIIRYPADPYDRIWYPMLDNPDWTTISTTSQITHFTTDVFEAPTAVLQTAVASTDSTTPLEFSWDGVEITDKFLVVLHFTELQAISSNIREFNVYRNGMLRFEQLRPAYLYADYIHSSVPFSGYNAYHYSLNATANSTLPPIINAIEIYKPWNRTNLTTDNGDVDAINAIKNEYQIQKLNLADDPCYPRNNIIQIICNYSSDTTRITNVNLSSSALSGNVSTSFANLTVLESLDLSNNSLNGTIPDFLGSIETLQILNLQHNNFCGAIPASLLAKSQSGSLQLSYDNGTKSCNVISPPAAPPPPSPKKIGTPIIVGISLGSALIISALAVFFVWIVKKKKGSTSGRNISIPEPPVNHVIQPENQQFTYRQLVQITSNFARWIGQGGFGTVYHGYVNEKQVAVKICTQSSTEGTKQFLSEVRILSRIHHRNLVPLVGYCMDRENLALVYDYMPNGSLADHLRDNDRHYGVLSWVQRLKIATEAAEGLEYLHRGCDPPLIHRDVKTTNILLGERLEAKIADFGLSKVYNLQERTHISTVSVVGTPGYLDPEYSRTYQLNYKSDVYSFGIVLLELITGELPIYRSHGQDYGVHIVQRVSPKVDRGDIYEIIDKKLQQKYDATSVWMIVDLAMRCTAEVSNKRPTMSQVVTQLKSSLELEMLNNMQDQDSQTFEVSQTIAPNKGDSVSRFGPHSR